MLCTTGIYVAYIHTCAPFSEFFEKRHIDRALALYKQFFFLFTKKNKINCITHALKNQIQFIDGGLSARPVPRVFRQEKNVFFFFNTRIKINTGVAPWGGTRVCLSCVI